MLSLSSSGSLLQRVSESSARLVKHQWLGSTFRVGDLLSLGWGPRNLHFWQVPRQCWTGEHTWRTAALELCHNIFNIWQIINPFSVILKVERLWKLNVFPWRLVQSHLAAKPDLNWGEAIYILSLSPGVTVYTVCCRNVNALDYRGAPDLSERCSIADTL